MTKANPAKFPTSKKELKENFGIGVVVYALSQHSGVKERRISEIEPSLVYIASSRIDKLRD